MEKHDEKIEKFLREFAPKRPGMLRENARPETAWARRFAAAATIVIVCGASVWLAVPGPRSREAGIIAKQESRNANGEMPEKKTSMLQLTKMALEEPEKLDATLAAAARNSLPKLRGNESTLRVLAKE